MKTIYLKYSFGAGWLDDCGELTEDESRAMQFASDEEIARWWPTISLQDLQVVRIDEVICDEE